MQADVAQIEPESPAVAGRKFWKVLILLVGFRLLIAAILATWEYVSPSPPHPDSHYYLQIEPDLSLKGQLFVKFDSYWYLNIIRYGYHGPVEGYVQYNMGFAPLYPALIKCLTLAGLDAVWVGMAISTCCYLLLLYFLHEYGSVVHSARLGRLLMIFVSVFPSAWVFHMVYTESMFCLWAAIFLVGAHRKQQFFSALSAALMPLTRFVGLAVFPAVVCDSLCRIWRTRKFQLDGLLWVGALSGAAGLCTIFWWITGDSLTFIHAKNSWLGGLSDRLFPLLSRCRSDLGNDPWLPFYLVLFAFYSFLCIVYLVQHRDLGGWFSAFSLMMYLNTPDPSGVIRFVLPLIPLHTLLLKSIMNHRWFVLAMMVLLAVSQVVLTRLELSWIVII